MYIYWVELWVYDWWVSCFNFSVLLNEKKTLKLKQEIYQEAGMHALPPKICAAPPRKQGKEEWGKM